MLNSEHSVEMKFELLECRKYKYSCSHNIDIFVIINFKQFDVRALPMPLASVPNTEY
jgi:hypothetical protein